MTEQNKNIYLAGGCFWGIEAYFSKLPGIISAISGYANGTAENPSYEEVCRGGTGFAETVFIKYKTSDISLEKILNHFFEIINPTTLNFQGNDAGTQYRSGIYYDDENDKSVILKALLKEARKYAAPIVTEVKKIENFYPAEQYHQKYLDKNPFGYCHIDISKIKKYERFKKPAEKEIKEKLTATQYKVTQESGTETPYTGKYNDFFEKGIYVDIVTGEPLFSSTDKYNSGCGWPAFSKPIERRNIVEFEDDSHGMSRTEVRSDIGNSHLGHVFEDGPADRGGMRYCINSAALRFIPLKDMEKEGYGDYIYLLNKKRKDD